MAKELTTVATLRFKLAKNAGPVSQSEYKTKFDRAAVVCKQLRLPTTSHVYSRLNALG
jgi:hypothetical protein